MVPSKANATPVLNRKAELETDNYNTMKKRNEKEDLDELEKKMKVN